MEERHEKEGEREREGEKWSTEKLFPVEEVRIGPTKVRNDRLKEVLPRDKPEVIRLRPKHFFPLLNKGKKVHPFLSLPRLPAKQPLRPFLAGITGLGRTSILV